MWEEEEDKKLFCLYKEKGSTWSAIAKEFSNRTENQVKNRFYSTLRRIATKKSRECPESVPSNPSKIDLLQYVDDAISYGHNCFTKRGRKKKHMETPKIDKETRGTPQLTQQQPIMMMQNPSYVPYVMPYPQFKPQFPRYPQPIYAPQPVYSSPRMMIPPFQHQMPRSGSQKPMAGLTLQSKLEEVVSMQKSIINLLLTSRGINSFPDNSTIPARKEDI